MINLTPEQIEVYRNNFEVGFRKTVSYLWDGEPENMKYLLYIWNTFKRRKVILDWLVTNEIKGPKLTEFFRNETNSNDGMLLAVQYILNTIDGKRYGNSTVLKKDELLHNSF